MLRHLFCDKTNISTLLEKKYMEYANKHFILKQKHKNVIQFCIVHYREHPAKIGDTFT